MSTFSDRIRLIFDVDTVGGVSSIKKLRSEVSSANGVMGKLKVGGAAVGGMLKENMAAAALAAGTALVAYGIKAVNAFTDTAKAAIDMGAAVGMGAENASRWIAVGDDMGVTADQLTTAFGKVGKSLDSGKWEEYGVATRDAGGNARKTNDIILDSFDALGKITNETQRAKAGNDLFGKGYANLAPMIGKTRAEMEAYLGSVEDGQVITTEEAKKAEKMRLAQDKLSDALHEVTMATGSFVANLGPLISALADVVTWTTSVQDKQEEWARDLVGLGDDVAMSLGKFSGATKEASDGTADYSRVLDDFTNGTARDFNRVISDQADALADADRNLQTLKGHLDERQAWLNAQDAVEAMNEKIADGTSDWRDLEAASIDAKSAVADYVTALDDIPPEVKSSLYVALDQGNLDGVRSFLDSLAKGFDIPLFPKVVGGVSINGSVAGKRAAGGPVSAGLPYLVGENGPEIVVPSGSGNVVPNHKLGAGGGVTNVYVSSMMTARQIAQEQARYNKLNGRG